ncbi:hypothetical protein Patl1_00145 [Pistacia atlantica]|uniref:Uncharacterized protein n=1 Tax=Pistacia atlantica TaxID=434234 RepID=A0ACC1C5E7_9ROSI|nr:hypothetical protein Patl1_00145 [Pistacia atlantica]
MAQTPNVVILPSPGMGHLIPFIQFAKHLVHLHNFHVTSIIPTIGSPPNAMKAAFQALPQKIDLIFLPPVSFDDLHEDIETPVPIALEKLMGVSLLVVLRFLGLR